MKNKKLYQDRDWLYQKYWKEKLSTPQIANYFYGIGYSTISYWMNKHGIKARTNSEAQNLKDKLYNHKSWLRQKYWEEKLSMPEIGKICGVGAFIIFCALKRHGIKTRSISESKKGKGFPLPVLRGEKHPWWGKHHSKETKEKMSKQRKNYLAKHPEILQGKNHPRWLGGISFEPYGIEFNERLKDEIRKRDDYTCQILDCNAIQNGKKFPVHHTDYNKRNNKDWNLVTLCHSCHSKTNTNREYWENYFNINQEKTKWKY